MILPIFLTTQFLSVKLDEKDSATKLVNLRPVIDPFTPVISTSRIRETLKDLLKAEELVEITPVVLSIAQQNYDIEPEYDFEDVTSSIPIPIIVPEYFYSKAIDIITPSATNTFLTCSKYGLSIPQEIKIQLDSVAISMYVKANVGKFIGQDQIIISTADVDEKFKTEYLEAMVKALADSIQIAGIWKITLDTEYNLFPNLVNVIETNYSEGASISPVIEFLEGFTKISDGKLIIAPGVIEMQIGEDDKFETLELTDTQLNKFKIKEDDKATFRWKSDKSKFDGEIYGSKTGIKIDVRVRT